MAPMENISVLIGTILIKTIWMICRIAEVGERRVVKRGAAH
jgi:hypothetical protein